AEYEVVRVKPTLLHHALIRARADQQFRSPIRPQLRHEPMGLHAVRPVGHAQAPDTIKGNISRSQTVRPVDTPLGQAELAKCPEHRWPIAIGDGLACDVRVPLVHRALPRLDYVLPGRDRPKANSRNPQAMPASVSKVKGI